LLVCSVRFLLYSVADVVWLKPCYNYMAAWMQLNKRELKQPATFNNPHVRTNFHTQKYEENQTIWVLHIADRQNGLHMVRIVRGTNSQWYEKSSNRSIRIA